MHDHLNLSVFLQCRVWINLIPANTGLYDDLIEHCTLSMQDLIEAAKNDDITTVEHILQKGENIRSIIDTRESDKVNSEG